MSSSDNKVVVRVEVEVNGVPATKDMEQRSVHFPKEAEKGFMQLKGFQIGAPQSSPSDTPVFWDSGSQSAGICSAMGTSLVLNAGYATSVQAIAIPSTNVNPLSSAYASPLPGSATSPVTVTGGWSFSQANGNPILGGTGDNTPGYPNNNTLLVWYLFGGATVLDVTLYHGLYTNSGSTCSSGDVGIAANSLQLLSRPKSTALVARFTGGLASLHEVRLGWNGVSWVGTTNVAGGSILTLIKAGCDYQLQASGPGANFVVAARPRSTSPFHFSADGVAIGTHHGPFHVDIIE